jgi:1-phosphatidylinositol phosphodiesterase
MLGVEGVNSRIGRWLLGQLGGEAPLQDLLGQEDWDVVDVEAGQASANSTAVEEIRLRGWVLMDFCDEPEGQEHYSTTMTSLFMKLSGMGLIPLLVEANWRGRKPGEEGWN